LVEFIFFLTHNDVTIPNAIEVFKEIQATNVKYIGFKDIGLPKSQLHELRQMIADTGKTAVLEVVSTSEEDNNRSIKMGVELGVDYLIGGTYVENSLPMVAGKSVKYFPYIGKIVGHPCLQRGTIEEICRDAERVERLGVDGIDLLSYRFDGDPFALTSAVAATVKIPVIAAGSINSLERIDKMKAAGVWGFTIGSAVLDKEFDPKGSIADQIRTVLKHLGQ
jgi:NAD(P)H-dependent flavin oxidoreductase YrpB (nitropropane dioxygenase family)